MRPDPATFVARTNVMVASHERSGTHFLINTLRLAYGYPESGFLNFDYPSLNINYFHAMAISAALRKPPPMMSLTIKSHHAADFFEGVLDDVLKQLVVLYIHRDPVDVMIINRWQWHEGPHRPTALEFAAAEPEGQMMRYQRRQARTLLHRWASHVDGWTAAAATRPRIVVVRYADLEQQHERTVSAFGTLLGRRSGTLARPDRTTNVVAGAPAVDFPAPDRAALRALALAEVGNTMRRHGYA